MKVKELHKYTAAELFKIKYFAPISSPGIMYEILYYDVVRGEMTMMRIGTLNAVDLYIENFNKHFKIFESFKCKMSKLLCL